MTFFGIFFRLLIRHGALVLFEEVMLVFGDDSCLLGRFEGDLLMVDVPSSFTEGFEDGLIVVDIAMGFFSGGGAVLAFEGEGIDSFFFVVDGFISGSTFTFDDGRDLSNEESRSKRD